MRVSSFLCGAVQLKQSNVTVVPRRDHVPTVSSDFSSTRENRQTEMETLNLIALVIPLSQLGLLAGQPRSSTPLISRA